MSLASEVKTGVSEVLNPTWNIVNGTRVPESKDIQLRNGAVKLNATYLYADMMNSTTLVQKYNKRMTAKVIRGYLNASSRIIRARGGEIRGFDGDRVMGIFIGDSKNTSAIKAAFQIQWAVKNVIGPKLKAQWNNFNWNIGHGIGVDTGEAFLVRGGVRGNNDLISIGKAPNISAKLSALRNGYATVITQSVYSNMHDSVKRYLDGTGNVWNSLDSQNIGGKIVKIYGTSYWRAP